MSTRGQLGLLFVGVGAIVLAMVAGRSDLLADLFQPPMPARLVLGVGAGVVALVIALRATERLGGADGDARELIRAVRLLFLAVGVAAVSAGWVIGSPVPVVAGLVIAGVDVLETTFLLLVTAARGR
jgi:hypothetical protein